MVNFGKAICEQMSSSYELACEHEHSNCILLANKERFYRDGQWHTWIDFEKVSFTLVGVLAPCNQKSNSSFHWSKAELHLPQRIIQQRHRAGLCLEAKKEVSHDALCMPLTLLRI